MAEKVDCPCGEQFRLPENFVGKRARCPACNRLLANPHWPEKGTAEQAELAAEGNKWTAARCELCGDDFSLLADRAVPPFRCPRCIHRARPAAAARPAFVEIDEQRTRPLPPDSDTEDERATLARRPVESGPRTGPRLRRRRITRQRGFSLLSPLAAIANRVHGGLLGLGLLLGPILVLASLQDLSVSEGATKRPQKLTLAELAARGPRGNNHVEVTGFIPGEGYVAFYRESSSEEIFRVIRGKKAEPVRWEYVHVPLFEGPDRRRIRAVVQASSVQSRIDLDSWCRQRRPIRGMITSKLSSRSETAEGLRELYPGVDLSDCHFIQEGQTPAGRGSRITVFLGILLTVLSGILLCLRLAHVP